MLKKRTKVASGTGGREFAYPPVDLKACFQGAGGRIYSPLAKIPPHDSITARKHSRPASVVPLSFNSLFCSGASAKNSYQLFCASLSGTLEKKKISFIYLLYDPKALPLENQVKTIINNVYERTVFECGRIDWSKLFGIILEFLNNGRVKGSITNEEINKIICDFSFALVSQDAYSDFIKN